MTDTGWMRIIGKNPKKSLEWIFCRISLMNHREKKASGGMAREVRSRRENGETYWDSLRFAISNGDDEVTHYLVEA